MKTAKAMIVKDKDILDLETNRPMKIMLWPTTYQVKEIPIPQHFQEGYLDDMEFWLLMTKQQLHLSNVMEVAVKEFTRMVASITTGKLWMGSMGKANMKLSKVPEE
ncbi:unnamed protein product [Lactuca saligna]|uniref:Uncharacterized protein n=1 Tax=Lactuca saligna TaxID=75948 RepID=A0AA35USD2_LACSI|nr:unnamed protein product [Lactuca saligna]